MSAPPLEVAEALAEIGSNHAGHCTGCILTDFDILISSQVYREPLDVLAPIPPEKV
jgi:hypothetical protein